MSIYQDLGQLGAGDKGVGHLGASRRSRGALAEGVESGQRALRPGLPGRNRLAGRNGLLGRNGGSIASHSRWPASMPRMPRTHSP